MNGGASAGVRWRWLAVAMTVAFCCVLAGPVAANGFRNPPAGAMALSLDGARSTLVDDPSAVSHNPANLPGMAGGAKVGVNTVFGGSEFDSPVMPKESADDSVNYIPSIHAVLPMMDGKCALGLGVSAPYGQAGEWDKTVPFAYYSMLSVVDISPAVALQVCSHFSVGVGANVYVSAMEQRSLVPLAPLPVPPSRLKVTGEGVGLGATIGLLCKPIERVKLALTYRSAFDINYDGDTRLSGIPGLPGAPTSMKTDFETEIRFPNTVTIGCSVRVSDALQVGAEGEWIEFSRNDAMPLDFGTLALGMPPGTLPKEVVNDWDDIWTAGVAGQWQCCEPVAVRASYKFMESPIPDKTYMPFYADADRHILAAGIGIACGRHILDLTYAINFIAERDIDNSEVPSPVGPGVLNGDYVSSSQIAGVSYGCSF